MKVAVAEAHGKNSVHVYRGMVDGKVQQSRQGRPVLEATNNKLLLDGSAS